MRDVMIRDVASISPDRPIRAALERMLRQDLPALPVVGDKREVLGIVAESDIMRALLSEVPRPGRNGAANGDDARDETREQLKVRDIMGRSVLCISEEMGLDEVASMMTNKDVTQLPVVDEGQLTGLITRKAILRQFFEQ